MLTTTSMLIPSPFSQQLNYFLIYLYYFLLNKPLYFQPLPVVSFDILPVFKHLSCTEESRISHFVPDEIITHTKYIKIYKPDSENILTEPTIFNYYYEK